MDGWTHRCTHVQTQSAVVMTMSCSPQVGSKKIINKEKIKELSVQSVLILGFEYSLTIFFCEHTEQEVNVVYGPQCYGSNNRVMYEIFMVNRNTFSFPDNVWALFIVKSCFKVI